MRGCHLLIAALAAGFVSLVHAGSPLADQHAGVAAPTLHTDVTPLMREGRYAEALIELERQLMLEPRNAGAWLDFALCSYALGRFDESQAIFDAIEREFSPSPAIRAVIASYRKPPPSKPIPRRWSADVALLAGYETNANAGLRLSSLTLTFPDTTTASLIIDPRYQARASSSYQLEAHAEGEVPIGASGVSLFGVGEWRDRHTPAATEFGTRQHLGFVGLGGSLVTKAPINWALWIGQQHASLGGQGLLDSSRILATLELPITACRARVGGDIERRRYPVQSVLDGRYRGIIGSLGCQAGDGQLFLTGRSGYDSPEGFRAGGVQSRSELTMTLHTPAVATGRLESTLSLSRQVDGEGYSILLGSIPREIHRRGLSFDYAQPVGEGWDWILRSESWAQHSNIELFQLRNTSILTGFRRRF